MHEKVTEIYSSAFRSSTIPVFFGQEKRARNYCPSYKLPAPGFEFVNSKL